jgi:hypothetical protein
MIQEFSIIKIRVSRIHFGAMACCALHWTPEMGGYNFDLVSWPLLFMVATIQTYRGRARNSPTFPIPEKLKR